MVWFGSRAGRDGFDRRMVLVYLVFLGFSEVLKIVVFRGYGGVSAASTALSGISDLRLFWYDSIFGFRLRYGGAMSSAVLLGLSVLGAYLLGRQLFPGLYFRVLLAVTSILFLIGNEAIKSRLLFNVPFGLFAASGLVFLLEQERMDDYRGGLASFVALSMVVYLFRSLANLVKVLV